MKLDEVIKELDSIRDIHGGDINVECLHKLNGCFDLVRDISIHVFRRQDYEYKCVRIFHDY